MSNDSGSPLLDASFEKSSFRPPITHEVKSWPNLFAATLRGEKTHEMRKTLDRDYRIADYLNLNEYDPTTSTYSGRTLLLRITYVTSTQIPCALSGEGLGSNYCILSVKIVDSSLAIKTI